MKRLFLLALLLWAVPLVTGVAAPALATDLPPYCQEGTPDYDPEMCEAEEGTAQEGSEGFAEEGDAGAEPEITCGECRELTENTAGADESDPQVKWKILSCRRTCGDPSDRPE